MNRVAKTILAIGVLPIFLVACGEGDTVTTVIREAPTTVEKTTTVEAPAEPARRSSAPSSTSTEPPESKSPPDVVGLSLPTAERLLAGAGFTIDVENTDTTFGVVVPDNFTVCQQDPPRGKIVHVLAQKYGC
ncbi:MAG TPA: PASTA domain-containing protein [Solirubrobacterales bacterium]